MKRKPGELKDGLDRPPKLLPAGSVDRVMLLGGKNLTTFQSIGLIFIGICVTGGIGGLMYVAEFGFETGAGDHGHAFYLLFLATAAILWGLVMIVNGFRGLARRAFRKR